MPESSYSRAGLKTSVNGEHRDGICEKCGTPVTKMKVLIDGVEKIRPRCPKCGGEGRLIARSVAIQPPDPPTCVSPRCIFRFMLDCLYVALLSSYHHRRVVYAQKNRHKKILERYRTGEPAPNNLWQAIHANIKLKCPICRRYDVDPLLFGGKR